MWIARLKAIAALPIVAISLAGTALLAPPTLADKPPNEIAAERATKDYLTPDSFPRLHKVLCRQPGEYRWDELPWLTSIWHARKQAVAENKPILVFRTHGAGFNDPLGNC